MGELMGVVLGLVAGFFVWLLVRLVFSMYTVDQDERAVKTSFGKAQRVSDTATTLDTPLAEFLRPEEKERYRYPQVRVIGPGGPYFRWPWEQVHKVSIATVTASMAWDPEDPEMNSGGTVLEGVTKDQLNTGLRGQIRYRISDQNLYAYLFGVKNPAAHVMGYFVSVLRERIAGFEAPHQAQSDSLELVDGVSINDLRKNMRDLNEHMDLECRCSAARYGLVLDASLITEIDPPDEVESALAAINTAHNHVSSEVSLAKASADQKVVQSKRAVEIETLRAQAEVEPLLALADQLGKIRRSPGALGAYLRNARLSLFDKARDIILEVR